MTNGVAYHGTIDSCFATSNPLIVVSPGNITDIAFQPGSVKGKGPDSFDIAISVKATVVNSIPPKGSIEVTLSTSWQVLLGISGCVSDIGSGTISGFKCTISVKSELKANAVATITFSGIIPPNGNNSTYDVTYISLLETFDNQGQLIDEYIDSLNNKCAVNPATEPEPVVVLADSKLIPNNSGMIVDLYIHFRTIFLMPVGTVISI